jgi:hypothetical protein
MPRYFFHLRNRHETIDEEGSEFADEDAARKEALASARELLADAIRRGRNFPPEQIVIADASGHELATVNLKDVLPAYLLD